MERIETRDLTFAPPSGWTDRSVVAFAAPAKPGRATTSNVVLTRDALPAGRSLRDHTDQQIVELAKRLAHFELRQRRELLVGDAPACELRFAWRSGNGPVEQRLVMAASPRGVLYNFTVTSPVDEADEVFAVFDRMLSSVHFR